MNANLRLSLLVLGAALGAAGCDDTVNSASVKSPTAVVVGEDPSPKPGGGIVTGDPTGPDGPLPTSTCSGGSAGIVYQGIGNVDLSAGRIENPLEVDRGRVKPYAVLAGEYQRALGKVPALYPQMASTFGASPARWYDEPEASAIILYSAYRIAFQGCLDYTATALSYAAAPTLESSATECGNFAVKFWNRAASGDELAKCAQLAVTDTAKEQNPRRRWAYVCATLLTASGFLTY